jgi:predicted Zn finger-like uncharacterized protein
MNLTEGLTNGRNQEIYDRLKTLCADEIQAVQGYFSQLKQERSKAGNALHGILGRERTNRTLACPQCGSVHFVKNGKTAQSRQKYRCRECKKSFSNTTDSITHSTKKSYRVWLRYVECMDDGLPLAKAAQLCGIAKTTAFAWRHKIMDSMSDCEKDEELQDAERIEKVRYASHQTRC